jgi:hypothetical protein
LISYSLNTDSNIESEGAIELSEALKLNSSLTWLNLRGNRLIIVFSFSLNVGNNIGNEGAIELSEALKSNTSLTSLNLNSNKLVVSFHSH